MNERVLTSMEKQALSLDSSVKAELIILDKKINDEKDFLKSEKLKIIRIYCFDNNIEQRNIGNHEDFLRWCELERIGEKIRMSEEEFYKQTQPLAIAI